MHLNLKKVGGDKDKQKKDESQTNSKEMKLASEKQLTKKPDVDLKPDNGGTKNLTLSQNVTKDQS